MDIRLYKKAKSVAEPFEFEEYRKRKIREKIEEERVNRVVLNKLPKVNKDLALKLMDEQNKKKKSGELLKDDRFKALFENPDFEVNKNAEEYRLLNPVLTRLDKGRKKELKKQLAEEVTKEEELEGKNSSEESSSEYDSSDDDLTWTKEMKKTHRDIQRERRLKDDEEERQEKERNEEENSQNKKLKFVEMDAEEMNAAKRFKRKTNKFSLGERLKDEDKNSVKFLRGIGNREMTFSIRKHNKYSAIEEKNKRHKEERKRLIRPITSIRGRHRPWRGK